MSVREEVEQMLKFEASSAPLAQRIWLEGGDIGNVTQEEQAVAQRAFFRALIKVIFHLADAIDGLKISEGNE